jgi:hypothetical protein
VTWEYVTPHEALEERRQPHHNNLTTGIRTCVLLVLTTVAITDHCCYLPGSERGVGVLDGARRADPCGHRHWPAGAGRRTRSCVSDHLANDLNVLGQMPAARQLNEDTSARLLRVLGEDHPDTVAAGETLEQS